MASLREALGAALDGDTPDTDTDTAVVDTTPDSVETESTEPVDTSPAPGTLAAEVEELTDKGTVRDALGRFVQKAVGAEAAAAPASAAPPPEAPAATDAPIAAPVSWRAEVKAEWGKLPANVQAEVSRRELEVQRVLSESGSARSIANQFTERVTPYMPFIRAEGLNNPLDAFAGLMDTHVALKTGSPYQKAEKLAGLVKHYGVDIQELDRALAGVAQEKPEDVMARRVQEMVSQQMAPVRQFQQQLEAQAQAAAASETQAVSAEMAAFEQKHPHFQTVRKMMADIMEVAERGGEGQLSLQEAYNRATVLHPSLRGVTLAAQTAQQAQQLNAAAQRAKAAARAGRVPTQTSAVVQGSGNRPQSLRDAIQNAMQDVPVA